MMLNNARNLKSKRGFSLLETMLAVGVAAVFFLFVINIGRTIAREQAIQAAANYVTEVDKALETYFSSPVRFSTLYATLQSMGGQAQVNINDLSTGSGVIYVSSSFPATAPFGQTYRVLLHIADNMAISTDNQVIEVFIASETLIEDSLALRISAALGGKGGAMRNGPVPGGTIRGAFGGWSAPTLSVGGTAWYANVTGSSVQPSLQNGAYVVAYHYYDQQRIAKDYLYRKDLGDTRLNRMEGDLTMNSYNVMGADNVATGGMLTGREVAVQGTANIAGVTNITGNVQADGPSSAAGNVTSSTPSSISAPGGTLVVQTMATTGTSVFSNNLTTNTLTSQDLTSENVTINNGAFNSAQTSGINANAGVGGLVVTGNTSAGSNYESSTLTSSDLTVSSGNTGMIYMQTNGNYNQTSGTTRAARFSGASTNRVGNTDWRCGNGC